MPGRDVAGCSCLNLTGSACKRISPSSLGLLGMDPLLARGQGTSRLPPSLLARAASERGLLAVLRGNFLLGTLNTLGLLAAVWRVG